LRRSVRRRAVGVSVRDNVNDHLYVDENDDVIVIVLR
jgi:hypothetical protein